MYIVLLTPDGAFLAERKFSKNNALLQINYH